MNNTEGKLSPTDTPRHLRNVDLRREYLRLEALEEAHREAGEHRQADLVGERKRNNVLAAFCAENKGLATNAAKIFIRGSDPNGDDYVQDGMSGLVKAFLKWDPDRGSTFATFAHRYINGNIQRGVSLVEHDQLSHSDFGAIKHVGTIASILSERLERAPSNKEISAYSKTEEWLRDENGKDIPGHQSYTPALVDRVRKGRPISLETPLGGESDGTLGDFVADKESKDLLDLDETAWWDHVRKVTSNLRPDELFVLTRREGLDTAWSQSLVDVAALTGEGRGTVSRKENAARGKIEGPIPSPLI